MSRISELFGNRFRSEKCIPYLTTHCDDGGRFGGNGADRPPVVYREFLAAYRLSFTEPPKDFGALETIHAALFYDVEGFIRVVLLQKKITLLKMHVLDQVFAFGLNNTDFPREKKVQRPIDDNSNLSLDARNLGRINRPPDEPGKKSGELDSHDVRYSHAMADGGKLSLRLVLKGFQWPHLKCLH